VKVREAIRMLSRFDPEAEFHVPQGPDDSTAADLFYESETTYGTMTASPRTVKTVVADYAFRGL
jgi:hypothetical protein